jgi:hypothetical protein
VCLVRVLPPNYYYTTAGSDIEPDIVPIFESFKRFMVNQACGQFTPASRLFNDKVRTLQSQLFLCSIQD